VKYLSLNKSSSSGINTGDGGFGGNKSNNNKNKYTKNDEIYDPSSMNAKAWKMAKIGGWGGFVGCVGCVGCAGCAYYDDPVVDYGYPVADIDSYSSFHGMNSEEGSIHNGSNGDKNYNNNNNNIEETEEDSYLSTGTNDDGWTENLLVRVLDWVHLID
jgi:hypothetical protein